MFTPEDGETRVVLEHRGWERLGDRGAASRKGYGQGWDLIFTGLYAEAAGKPAA